MATPDFPARAQFVTADGLLTAEASRFLAALVRAGNPVAGVSIGVPLTGSPLTYAATARGWLSLTGGAVSSLGLVRQGAATTLDPGAAVVPLSAGDAVTITYTGLPALTFIPE